MPLDSMPQAGKPVEYNLTTTTIPPHSDHDETLKFNFPSGTKNMEQWDSIENKLTTFFLSLPNAQASKENFDKITKLCDCPLYFKTSLFIACGGKEHQTINMSQFIKYWKDVWSSCSDIAAIFVRVLTHDSTRKFLTRDDFIVLIQDVIDTHPGLRRLKSAPKFHSSYSQTVIASIFYDVSTSWSGNLNITEIRQSKLIAVIYSLEYDDTIKKLPSYFNYEQYYVIERKFWELDRRGNLTLNINDLNRYNRHAISKKMLNRIFSGTVLKREEHSDYDKLYMDYWDFVWFIRSEEDKTHTKAIEYWFRCMDIDGDEYLSLFELKYFYVEQLERLKSMGMEGVLPPFKECIHEILHTIKPKYHNKISLSELKTYKMINVFFNTFFNIDKYIKYMEYDSFETLCEWENTNEKSEWETFIEQQYQFFKCVDLKKNKKRRNNYKTESEETYLRTTPHTTNQPHIVTSSDGMSVASMPLASMPLTSVPLSNMPQANIPVFNMPLASVPLYNMQVDRFPLYIMPVACIPNSDMPLACITVQNNLLITIPILPVQSNYELQGTWIWTEMGTYLCLN